MDKIIENTRKIIADDKTVFAAGKWTPKREAYFEVYKALMTAYPIESVLNIGVGPALSALKWNNIIKAIFPSITHFENIDIELKAVEKAKAHGDPLIKNTVLGDVKNLLDIYGENAFDLIYWNQGPEHIFREEREKTFAQLDLVAKKVIYMHCPWGRGYDGDTWHYSKNIQKSEFEEFGFECVYHGKKDSRNAGIMSYKVL